MISFFGELVYLNEEWRNDSAIQTVTGKFIPKNSF